MNHLNSVMLEGNMVREPSLRSIPGGAPVCTFRLAFNRYFKKEAGKEPEVSFFDVETLSKIAEICYNQGHKGLGVRIMGRLKQNRWNDSNGKLRSKVCIVAEQVEFKTGKNEFSSLPKKDRPPENFRYREEHIPTF